MKTFIVTLIMLFAAGVQADTTAKIDKILMFEGGNTEDMRFMVTR